MMIFSKKRIRNKIIFSAHIDLKYQYTEKGWSIKKDGKLLLNDNEKHILVKDIENKITNTIKYDLVDEIKNITGLTVTTQIKSIHYNSIEVIFTVILKAFSFIASIKGFYGSIIFIQKHAQRIIRSNLINQFGNYFDVNVSPELPNLDERHFSIKEFDYLLHRLKHYPGIYNPINSNKRDGLFYYLLFSNIVLLAIIILLILKAVLSYYG